MTRGCYLVYCCSRPARYLVFQVDLAQEMDISGVTLHSSFRTYSESPKHCYNHISCYQDQATAASRGIRVGHSVQLDIYLYIRGRFYWLALAVVENAKRLGPYQV